MTVFDRVILPEKAKDTHEVGAVLDEILLEKSGKGTKWLPSCKERNIGEAWRK